MTSFKAMTDTSRGMQKVLSVTSDDRYLSYLPIAHGMERWIGMVSLHFFISSYQFLFSIPFLTTGLYLHCYFFRKTSAFLCSPECKSGTQKPSQLLLLISTVVSPLSFCRSLGKSPCVVFAFDRFASIRLACNKKTHHNSTVQSLDKVPGRSFLEVA